VASEFAPIHTPQRVPQWFFAVVGGSPLSGNPGAPSIPGAAAAVIEPALNREMAAPIALGSLSAFALEVFCFLLSQCPLLSAPISDF